MQHLSSSQRLGILICSTLLLAACSGAAAQPVSDSLAAAPAGCNVEDGKWKGVISFKASNCILSNLVLSLYSGDAGYGSVYFVYVQGEVHVENNQFAHEEALSGGTLTIQGAFTSANAVQGTYAVTKGSKIGGGTATVLKDINQEWEA